MINQETMEEKNVLELSTDSPLCNAVSPLLGVIIRREFGEWVVMKMGGS